jgi:hypothetical protein
MAFFTFLWETGQSSEVCVCVTLVGLPSSINFPAVETQPWGS